MDIGTANCGTLSGNSEARSQYMFIMIVQINFIQHLDIKKILIMYIYMYYI